MLNIQTGKSMSQARLVVYGPPGAGKSTFGAGCPSPVFICGEDGVRHLDVARFPLVTRWADVTSAVEQLATEPHEFKTLVIDTLDSIEPHLQAYIFDHVKSRHAKATRYSEIEFGKGPLYSIEYWTQFLRSLDALQRKRSMNLVLLAHSQIRMRKEPMVQDYERHTLKLEEKGGASAVFQWADDVLFATAFDGISGDRQTSVGERTLVCDRAPGVEVKNRRDLPKEIPLSWDAYWTAQPSRSELVEKLLDLLPNEEEKDKAKKWSANKSADEIKRAIERKSK